MVIRNRPKILKTLLAGFAVVLVALAILFVSGFGGSSVVSSLLGLAVFLAIAITTWLAHRQEIALVERVDQAEDTLDMLTQAIIRVDADGRLDYLNPAASRLLDLPTDPPQPEQLPRHIELIHGTSRKPLLPMLLADAGKTEHCSLPAEARLITHHGIELEVEGSCRIVRSPSGQITVAILQLRDVTEEREWTRRQPDLWDRDPLTALPGRNFLVNRLARILERERAGDRPVSFIHIEIDGVGDVYRQAGNQAGDALVRHLTALLRPQIRDTDVLARLDTHRFGALLTLCPEQVTERIKSNILYSLTSSHFHWEGQVYRIGARLGNVHIPPFSGSVEELLAAAAARHD